MFTADEIEKIVSSRRAKGEGQSARFFPLNEKWGFKLFWHWQGPDAYGWVRDVQIQQKVANSLGIAPAVGEMFTIQYGTKTVHGFVTESVVETMYDRHFNHLDYHEDDMDDMYDRADYQELKEKMLDNNLTTSDLHWGNVGYLPDGRLVAIDFS